MMKRYMWVINVAIAFLVAVSSLGPAVTTAHADGGDSEIAQHKQDKDKDKDRDGDNDKKDRGRGNDNGNGGRGKTRDRAPGTILVGFAGQVTSVSCDAAFSVEIRGTSVEVSLVVVPGITLFRYSGGNEATCADLRVGSRVDILAWRTTEQA